uniref:Putative secreted protein n=1 Tax=Ixodes ricinus TaxID=34613 RepID=A0A6B0U304_IXORI
MGCGGTAAAVLSTAVVVGRPEPGSEPRAFPLRDRCRRGDCGFVALTRGGGPTLNGPCPSTTMGDRPKFASTTSLTPPKMRSSLVCPCAR